MLRYIQRRQDSLDWLWVAEEGIRLGYDGIWQDLLHELQGVFGTGGRKFTQEEMNERPQADPDGVIPADVNRDFGAAMVEEHRREGQDMLRFREFERELGDAGMSFTQRERYLLFLDHESHLSDEGREQFLRFLQHERDYLHEYILEALGINIPGDYDSD